MQDNEFSVRCVTETAFIGAFGTKFATEAEARRSLIVEAVREILHEAGYEHDEEHFDSRAAVNALIARREEVARLLALAAAE
jgi:hypothetical protein